jgi:type IV secretion system protein VirB6
MKRIIYILSLVILSLSISSCDDSICLEPDDFGFSYVKVRAYNKNPKKYGEYEYVDWQDSGLTLNGNHLHITVRNWEAGRNINTSSELSAWCPWYGDEDEKKQPSLSSLCKLFGECQLPKNDNCFGEVTNAPCLMKKGMGLYMIAAPKDFNPNLSFNDNQDPSRNPNVIVSHLGIGTDPSSKFYDYSDLFTVETGGYSKEFNTSDKIKYTDGKLYFKILDNYYQDNSGQYIAVIKSGVTNTSWDPTDWAVNMVKDMFFGSQNEPGIIKSMFENIIKKPGYKIAVSSLLSLYIILYGFNFLIGNVKISHHDLFFRILKILIVSQLLTSERAWIFFNQYLFDFFIMGSQSVIDIIKESGGSGPGSSSLLSFMLAPQTFYKLSSLLFAGDAFAFGLVYLLVYFVTLIVIFTALIYAAVLYISSLVMIGLIIVVAPIFLCFLLFEKTKDLFENWLKELVAFSMQAIIVVAATTIVSITIKDQIYKTLGFRVCQYNLLDEVGITSGPKNATSNLSGNDSRGGFNIWKPSYPGQNEQTKIIPLPMAHFDNNGSYCEPYKCQGARYPSFPFLDPANPEDNKKLQKYKESYGNLIDWHALLIIVFSAILLLLFMSKAANIARFIGGSAYSGAGATANSILPPIRSSLITGFNAIRIPAKPLKIIGYTAPKKLFSFIKDKFPGKNSSKTEGDVVALGSSMKNSLSSKNLPQGQTAQTSGQVVKNQSLAPAPSAKTPATADPASSASAGSSATAASPDSPAPDPASASAGSSATAAPAKASKPKVTRGGSSGKKT